MCAVARGTLATFEWRVMYRLGHLGLHHIMAGTANLGDLARQLRFAVRSERVTAFARLIRKWRMFIGANQFWFARNMRIVAVCTVGGRQVI